MPTGQQYSSVATQALLTAGISNANTSCSVNTTSGFPAAPFTAVLDIGTATQEIVDVTNVSGLTLTITRGVDGSAAQAHSNGATFTHSAIARDFREARAHIDASSSNDTQGHSVHGLASGSSVVGTTDTQTLSNKTLTSPTINSPTISGMSVNNPTITGTVAGGASYTSPSITGTVSGDAEYDTITLKNSFVGNLLTSQVPLTFNALAGTTVDLLDIQVNGTNVFEVRSDGSLFLNNTDTTKSSAVINAPSATSANILLLQKNSVNQVSVDSTGQLNLLTSPLKVSGITGAATASRYVGATSGGPPSSGTFSTGDWVMDVLFGGHWLCTAGGSPGTWIAGGQMLISSQTLGAPATSIAISGIPGNFRHLRLECNLIASTATVQTPVNLTFNGDSSTHYEHTLVYQSNSTTQTSTHTSGTSFVTVGFAWGNSATNVSGNATIDISNYASTFNTNKAVKSTFVSTDGGATNWNAGSTQGVWFGTGTPAAITSMSLTLTGGLNFATGSTAQLYGLP